MLKRLEEENQKLKKTLNILNNEISQLKKGKQERANLKFSFSNQHDSLSELSPGKNEHNTSSIKIEDIKDRSSKEGESTSVEKLSMLVNEYG